MFVGVLNQQSSDLGIGVLEQVEAAQPFVASDFGLGCGWATMEWITGYCGELEF